MPMPVSETWNSKLLVDARGYRHGARFGKLDGIVDEFLKDVG